jgi:hypothetical protein
VLDMAKKGLEGHLERLATLEERVFEGHSPLITEIRSELKNLNNRVWLIVVLLAGNLGTGIWGILK